MKIRTFCPRDPRLSKNLGNQTSLIVIDEIWGPDFFGLVKSLLDNFVDMATLKGLYLISLS